MPKRLFILAFFVFITGTALAQTPAKDLRTAVLKNKPAEVQTLLTGGADANAPVEMVPGFPTSYLFIAADNNHLDVAKSLLHHKAQVNKGDKFQLTPLMAAASKGYLEMVQLLLTNGADAKAKDEEGKTALAYAKEGNHAAVVALLEPKTK
ncbi:ankyrin repeat domain-containing protein [Hymenobacter aerilatus]|uniref:Ankyrin repeat domain-containing protein n=1 Tax=Hymenobacter aerilatus TaxID=2932251 RepID=A0A8T9T2S9_9BACT|nr:ankyrin repeat domain-containing protein [Hymenobacter aerilatus]UOR06426.1 ankyrin repeat domain-containing protein [Hymenobacter aerilatus]